MSEDGRRLAGVVLGTPRIWDGSRPEAPPITLGGVVADQMVNALAIGAEGGHVAAVTSGSAPTPGTSRGPRWRTPTMSRPGPPSAPLAMSRDGARFVVSPVQRDDPPVRRPVRGRIAAELHGPTKGVDLVAFTPDGKILVAAGGVEDVAGSGTSIATMLRARR